jgi:hypothetical protein
MLPTLTNYMVAGIKEKLIERLIKAKDVNDDPQIFKEKLKSFLQPTAALADNIKPTITAWYADTFKAVDRFNALLGHLKWNGKMMKKQLVWWYYTFVTLIVNTYLLWNDIKATGSVTDEPSDLKQFVLDLCDELL